MYAVSTPEVIILDRVRRDPLATGRLERMLGAIQADRIIEVDDAGLAETIQARGWHRAAMRTGQHRMQRQPALIFSTFRWVEPDAAEALRQQYPELASHMLLGLGPWGFRDHTRHRRQHQCVCQSAWEIHCAFGCLHACDYCHVPPYLNIMLNLEQLGRKVKAFGETIPEQKLYKFDNGTDTICLEPEYGASEVMVRVFADWPGRYLLLYTKSDNVDHLLKLAHKGRTLISWSLSCDTVASRIEKRTPSLDARLRAMARCQEAGYRVRARLSPICPVRGWREEMADMIARLLTRTRPEVISIDVVGWMGPGQTKRAMDVSLFDPAYAAALDWLEAEGFEPKGKHVFPHEMRAEILRSVLEEIKRLRPEQAVSLCMETTDMWRELGALTGMTPDQYACCCGPTCVPGHPLLTPQAGT